MVVLGVLSYSIVALEGEGVLILLATLVWCARKELPLTLVPFGGKYSAFLGRV